MTIDEAIVFSRYKASQQYSEIEGYEYDAEEHRQLADWLEELKELKQCVKSSAFRDGYEKGRNDAIEEFIKNATEERDNIFNWDEDEYENGMRAGYQYSIEIAEQMKEGK